MEMLLGVEEKVIEAACAGICLGDFTCSRHFSMKSPGSA